MVTELPVESLRRTSDYRAFSCQATDELAPLEAIIGQDRAVKSLEFGLDHRTGGDTALPDHIP
jgi:hypothetical protein